MITALENIGIVVLTIEYYLLVLIRKIAVGPNPHTLSDFIEGRVSGKQIVWG